MGSVKTFPAPPLTTGWLPIRTLLSKKFTVPVSAGGPDGLKVTVALPAALNVAGATAVVSGLVARAELTVGVPLVIVKLIWLLVVVSQLKSTGAYTAAMA